MLLDQVPPSQALQAFHRGRPVLDFLRRCFVEGAFSLFEVRECQCHAAAPAVPREAVCPVHAAGCDQYDGFALDFHALFPLSFDKNSRSITIQADKGCFVILRLGRWSASDP